MTHAHRFHAALQIGRALLLPALLAGALFSPAHANWVANGLPIGTGHSWQGSVAVCGDDAGNSIVVWRGMDAVPGAIYQLHAQRLGVSGGVQWAAGGVEVAPATGHQSPPTVLSTPDGGAFVAWHEEAAGNTDIRLQRLAADGAPFWGWPAGGLVVSSYANFEYDPVLASDGAGGVYVAWRLMYSATDADVYGAHILGNGVPDASWPGAGRPFCTRGTWEDGVILVPDATGGFLMAWRDSSQISHETRLYVTRILSSGNREASWNSYGNDLCAATGRQGIPNLVTDGAGGVIAAWRDFRSDASGDVYAGRVSASGAELWTPDGVAVCAQSGAQGEDGRLPLVPDGASGAVLAWVDARAQGTSGLDVYAQRVDAAGTALWASDGVELCSATGAQSQLALCADGGHGAVAVWSDARAGLDVYGQHVAGDGHIAWPRNGLAFGAALNPQERPAVVGDGAGGAIAAWEDLRTGYRDVYVNQMTGYDNLAVTPAPPGWDAPIVPRNDATATEGAVHVSPVLDGNQPTTRFNLQTSIVGPNPIPSYTRHAMIDQSVGWELVSADNLWPGLWTVLNLGAKQVNGGRHTMSIEADRDLVLPETNETDNTWMGQYIWSPLFLGAESPVERPLPGDWGLLPWPNTDGMAYARTDLSVAWLVSTATRVPGTDLDLYVYDDYTGSTSGFSHPVGMSAQWETNTDFVVGHYMSTPTILYPGAYRYGAAANGTFYADAAEAGAHQGYDPPLDWNGQPMLPGRLGDVYELRMSAGTTYYVTVAREAGASTLQLALFPSTQGGVYGRHQAAAYSAQVSGTVAQLAYTAPSAGWYPLVVYQATGESAHLGVRYSLHWSTQPLVDVPAEPAAGWTLAFEGARPNPVRTTTMLRFTLTRPGPVRLEIFDARGRLVRRLVGDEARDAGEQRVLWNGLTDAGRPAPSGIHWARLTAEGRSFVRKVALVR